MHKSKSGEERGVSLVQLRLWSILAGMFIAGVICAVFSDYWPWQPMRDLTKELGAGLFVAALLGITVEQALTREFGRDVFRAAFGYVLPDEIKDEASRIISYRFMCIENRLIVEITPVGNGIVKVGLKIERTIKNITRHSEGIRNAFAADEWAIPEHKSEIVECILDAGDAREEATEYETGNTRDTISKITETVEIKSGGKVKMITKAHEFRRENGEIFMSFQIPTVKPSVKVIVPDRFKHKCAFGVPGEQGRITKSSIDDEYWLDGTQFPGQHTRIRWWPDDAPSVTLPLLKPL